MLFDNDQLISNGIIQIDGGGSSRQLSACEKNVGVPEKDHVLPEKCHGCDLNENPEFPVVVRDLAGRSRGLEEYTETNTSSIEEYYGTMLSLVLINSQRCITMPVFD